MNREDRSQKTRLGTRPKGWPVPVRGKIRRLPAEVRMEINWKLRDGWGYATIAKWLLAQNADRDIPALHVKAGDSYLLVWARDRWTDMPVYEVCERAIGRWYRTPYRKWLKAQSMADMNSVLDSPLEGVTGAISSLHRGR